MNFDEFLQPAIFGLTGKPGAGKSYFATRCIIAEILKGRNRTIVTNVPVNKEKLREYVKKDFIVYDLATFSDNRLFFTNRGHYHLEIENTDANIDFKELLRDDDDGILFIIDEAHLYFNARNWKHMSQATLSYITFIRHVGDSLIWMCQKYSDIDSQFRGKTQAFHVLRNLAKEKLGIFKRGSGFRCYQYQNENEIASHGGSYGTPSQDFTYPFNIKVAECYNTSLFNKAHDKKYSIKGIPIAYVGYTFAFLLVAVLVWVANGGFRQILSWATPDIAKVPVVSKTEIVKANALPSQDPFKPEIITEKTAKYEVPTKVFSGAFNDTEDEEFLELTALDYERYKDKWFGKTTRAKITFFSEGTNKDKDFEFNFNLQWQKFMSFTDAQFLKNEGLYALRTPMFNSFLNWVDANGIASNVKETEILIKENVPFELNHGYQLPSNNTFSSNGVVQTSRSYQQIGFQLKLILECIDGLDLLRVEIENSDVMDLASEQPILQTFQASNVIDVTDQTTYLIADFNSQSVQKSKGFLRSNDYESNLNNKIFLSYGNN